MNSNQMMKRAITFTVLLLALFAVSWTALAQTGGGFDLSWSNVDGGGGRSAGGEFALEGTIGQADANNELAGGDFILRGGFQTSELVESGIRGDCNGDQIVDAGDVTAGVLEIFDGDPPTPPYDGGAFAGSAGCDANEDGTVDAGDMSCIVLIIFSRTCDG